MSGRPARAPTRTHRVFLRPKPLVLGAIQPRSARCMLLCVDVAANAGWAVYMHGRLFSFGEVTTRNAVARKRVVMQTVTSAHVRGLPLIAAFEAPFGGHLRAALSLTAALELWRDAWSGAGQPMGNVIELNANQWRKPLFGKRPLARKVAREMEQQLAAGIVRRDLMLQPRALGADECAAICMGQPLIKSTLVTNMACAAATG